MKHLVVVTIRSGWLAASVCIAVLCGTSHGVGAQGRSTPAQSWDTLSADVTVRRSSAGEGPGGGPATQSTKYHWEETDTPNGLKTAMTLVSAEAPTVRTKYGDVPLADTMPYVRIEDPGDGSELRLLDRHGKPIELTEAQRSRFTTLVKKGGVSNRERVSPIPRVPTAGHPGRDRSVRGLTIAASGNAQRRARLVVRFGESKGKVRNLDRYLRSDGPRTTEALADPASGVVLEMNVVEGGALRSHRTWEYEPLPDGQLMQRRVHSEHVVDGAGGLRTITDITFDNVHVERRGR